MKKILFLSLTDKKLVPYISQYLKFSTRNQNELLFLGKKQRDYEEFNKTHFVKKSKFRALNILKFKLKLRKLLLKQRYDVIIILHSQLSVVCNNELFFYKGDIVLDIRDYILEDNFIYSTLQNIIIKKSKFTVISSPGYTNFLPKNDYLVSHNIPNFIDKEYIYYKSDNRINIGQVGLIRFTKICNDFIELFKNDTRFKLSYKGRGSENLNKQINTVLIPEFDSIDTLKMYEDIDIVNNCYGNEGNNLIYALSNKLYIAAYLKKPILVSPDTFMEKVAHKYGIGITFNHKTKTPKEDIDKLYEKYHIMMNDSNKMEENCNRLLVDSKNEMIRFDKCIRKLLGEES